MTRLEELSIIIPYVKNKVSVLGIRIESAKDPNDLKNIELAIKDLKKYLSEENALSKLD